MLEKSISEPLAAFRFADFELDPIRRELHCAGSLVPLEPKPLRVLVELVRSAGEVVSKSDLMLVVVVVHSVVKFDLEDNMEVEGGSE